MIAALVYILAVLSANYTATWFIPLPLFGYVAVGTLLFGFTFTQRDRVHRYGRRAVYLMLAVTALLAGLESLVLGVPFRIIGASLLTILIAESADTEVYQRLIKRSWLVRVAGSNAVSIPLDSLLFNLLAFAGVFAPEMLVGIIAGEIVVKTTVGVVSALWVSKRYTAPPVIHALPE